MPDASDSPDFRAMVERSRRSDQLAIFGSGLVAVLGITVSTYNVYLQRVQIRAQVWPHLEIARDDTGGFKVEANNTGVGPAIVKGVRVSSGETVFKTWDEVRAFAFRDDPGAMGHVPRYKAGLVGRVLPPGGSIRAFYLEMPDNDDVRARVTERLWKLQIEACSCSTLGECWMLHEETPVAACPMETLTWAE